MQEFSQPTAITRVFGRAASALTGVILFCLGLWGYLGQGGLLPVEYWWLSAIGIAFLVMAPTLGTVWQRSGWLAALYLIGFAAQLTLRDPFWFQHFRVFPNRFSIIPTGVIALQALVGLVVIWRAAHWRGIVGFGSSLGWWRVAVMALIFLIAAKSPMDFIAGDNIPRYFKQLVFGLFFLSANLLNLAAIVIALPADGLTRGAARLSAAVSMPDVNGDGQLARFDRLLPWVLAGFAFAVSAAISLWSFDRAPHLDGITYLFHARYFSHGLVSLPIPADTEAFGHYLMDTGLDRWFSVNLPGWPAALAISLWFGAPWLLNPLLAAACVLLTHRFLTKQTDRGFANLVAFLLATSPWFLSLSATMLLHTFTLALILGAWVLLQSARTNPGIIAPLIAGLLMGWLFTARPLEGVYMGGLTGLWALGFVRFDRRHWRTVIAYGVGCIAAGAMLFAYNIAVTGSPLILPMDVYLDDLWGVGANGIGFGPEKGPPDWGNVDAWPGHSPMEALVNAHENLVELNHDLLGWGSASLFFVLAFVMWGRWDRLSAAMALITAITFVVYAFYWHSGGFYAGPRYWFMMMLPMLLFAGRGIITFGQRIEIALPGQAGMARIGALVLVLAFGATAIMQNWLALNKYPDINRYHADYAELADQPEMQNALVFVTMDRDAEFSSAFWVNDFAPGATTPLFARDMGAETNRAIAEFYPERTVWYAQGRDDAHARVTITQGPVARDEMP